MPKLTLDSIKACVKHLKEENPDAHSVYMAMADRIHKESLAKMNSEKSALKRTLQVFSQKVIEYQLKKY